VFSRDVVAPSAVYALVGGVSGGVCVRISGVYLLTEAHSVGN
jgi:hypothetical protein